MKPKFLLPVLAMIFAVGMSFTTVDGSLDDPNEDYIWKNGTFVSIGTEMDCGIGNQTCKVRLQDGNVYPLYDAQNLDSLKKGDGLIRDVE